MGSRKKGRIQTKATLASNKVKKKVDEQRKRRNTNSYMTASELTSKIYSILDFTDFDPTKPGAKFLLTLLFLYCVLPTEGAEKNEKSGKALLRETTFNGRSRQWGHFSQPHDSTFFGNIRYISEDNSELKVFNKENSEKIRNYILNEKTAELRRFLGGNINNLVYTELNILSDGFNEEDYKTFMNPLELAILSRKEKVAKELFYFGGKVQPKNEFDIIYSSIRYEEPQMLKLLINAENLNKMKGGLKLVDYSIVYPNFKCFKLLFRVNDINRVIKRTNVDFGFFSGSTLLHLAVLSEASNDKEKIISYLIEHGIALNKKDMIGRTAIDIAVFSKDWVIVKLLLQNGATLSFDLVKKTVENGNVDINSSLIDGNTLLHLVFPGFQFEIITYLLEKGANPSALNDKNEIPGGKYGVFYVRKKYPILLEVTSKDSNKYHKALDAFLKDSQTSAEESLEMQIQGEVENIDLMYYGFFCFLLITLVLIIRFMNCISNRKIEPSNKEIVQNPKTPANVEASLKAIYERVGIELVGKEVRLDCPEDSHLERFLETLNYEYFVLTEKDLQNLNKSLGKKGNDIREEEIKLIRDNLIKKTKEYLLYEKIENRLKKLNSNGNFEKMGLQFCVNYLEATLIINICSPQYIYYEKSLLNHLDEEIAKKISYNKPNKPNSSTIKVEIDKKEMLGLVRDFLNKCVYKIKDENFSLQLLCFHEILSDKMMLDFEKMSRYLIKYIFLNSKEYSQNIEEKLIRLGLGNGTRFFLSLKKFSYKNSETARKLKEYIKSFASTIRSCFLLEKADQYIILQSAISKICYELVFYLQNIKNTENRRLNALVETLFLIKFYFLVFLSTDYNHRYLEIYIRDFYNSNIFNSFKKPKITNKDVFCFLKEFMKISYSAIRHFKYDYEGNVEVLSASRYFSVIIACLTFLKNKKQLKPSDHLTTLYCICIVECLKILCCMYKNTAYDDNFWEKGDFKTFISDIFDENDSLAIFYVVYELYQSYFESLGVLEKNEKNKDNFEKSPRIQGLINYLIAHKEGVASAIENNNICHRSFTCNS